MRVPEVSSKLIVLFGVVNVTCFLIAAALVGAWSDPDARPTQVTAISLETPRPEAPLVDLRGADLRGADFRGRSLENVLLSGAQLQRADLRGTDLSGALLTRADLRGALYDGLTRWPAGFQPEAAGALFSPTPEQHREPEENVAHA
jgi:hypothetical protein